MKNRIIYNILVILMMKNQPFYAEGLCFSCIRCSACCRHESGYVFLSETDVSRLAAACKITYTEFVERYCRWIPSTPLNSSEYKSERLSLKEKSDFDCIFWDSGCKVYHSRPLQCKAFPFWPTVLNFKKSWEKIKAGCPGMDQGKLHKKEEIEALLHIQAAEPVLTRKAQNTGRW